jgi:hypothetical protein
MFANKARKSSKVSSVVAQVRLCTLLSNIPSYYGGWLKSVKVALGTTIGVIPTGCGGNAVSWPVISLIALAVGIGSLVMSFARTGPEEAAKNLANWIAALRTVQARINLEKFLRSGLYRFLSGLVAVLGAIAPIYSSYEHFERWWWHSSPPVISQPSNPPVPTPPTTTPSPPAKPPPIAPPPYQDPTPFSGMTNDDIKKVVGELSEELKKFEKEYEAQREKIGNETWTATNSAERQKEFDDRQARLTELHRVEQARFQLEFLSQLRALQLEIGVRLNKTPEGNTQPEGIGEGATALGSGILLTHRPLTDLANWFVVYAGKLK